MGKKEKEEDGLNASFIISQAKKRNRELQPYDPDEEQEEIKKDTGDEDNSGKSNVVTPREENRRRKTKTPDYESLFIRDSPLLTRSGKGVYIRKEFHDRIMRIIQVIAYNNLSLFSYLDMVLEHNFETFQDYISELYKKRTPDIF